MRLSLPWFLPIAILVGCMGTRCARDYRHTGKLARRRDDWILLGLAWWPLLVWFLSLFVAS